jgi:hypothetical protein
MISYLAYLLAMGDKRGMIKIPPGKTTVYILSIIGRNVNALFTYRYPVAQAQRFP